MSTPDAPLPTRSGPPRSNEIRPGFRTKTISARLTPEELAEVEAAAENAGQVLSEWLRDTALRAARQQPADPTELVLAELWAVRYTLANLFHAGAQAALEGGRMSPDSVLKIRDRADVGKLQEAHRLLEDFLARQGGEGKRRP